MSKTVLYREGKNKHYWHKYFAKSAIFADEDVEKALKSGEWYRHPSEVPQPGDEKPQETQPAAPESHESAPMVQSHYQAVKAPSDAVEKAPAKTKKPATKKAK